MGIGILSSIPSIKWKYGLLSGDEYQQFYINDIEIVLTNVGIYAISKFSGLQFLGYFLFMKT